MRRLAVLVLFIACAVGARLHGQIAAAAAGSPAPVKKAEKPAKKKEDKSPVTNLFGSSAAGLQSNEPVTTEIYADEAFFDSTKNMGIFSGRVKVIDPRFNLQSDKLTVFITKGQNQSLEKGRADKATYTAATGDVELRGTPRVQEGANMHVATSPDTVMIINQNSQLSTHGPSRTEIRQQPDGEKKAKTTPSQTPPSQTSPAQTPPPATLPKP